MVYTISINSIGSVLILYIASDCQISLCNIVHSGPGGHRRKKSTEKFLRCSLLWTNLMSKNRLIILVCLHFLPTTGGGNIPRPFGSGAHKKNSKDLVQFNYMEIGQKRRRSTLSCYLRTILTTCCFKTFKAHLPKILYLS